MRSLSQIKFAAKQSYDRELKRGIAMAPLFPGYASVHEHKDGPCCGHLVRLIDVNGDESFVTQRLTCSVRNAVEADLADYGLAPYGRAPTLDMLEADVREKSNAYLDAVAALEAHVADTVVTAKAQASKGNGADRHHQHPQHRGNGSAVSAEAALAKEIKTLHPAA
jgi:hypothetical protein